MSARLASELARMGIRDDRVLRAVAETPRRWFVPPELAAEADADRPLPIGFGQTISQPWIVAFMLERLALRGAERVLEVGTGSGYQAALLARLAREVWSIECLAPLTERARRALAGLGLGRVHLRVGDGRLGWPEAAPFDRIVVAAAPAEVPPALVVQLAAPGRMVMPVGVGEGQILRELARDEMGGLSERDLVGVRFVPLVDPGPLPAGVPLA